MEVGEVRVAEDTDFSLLKVLLTRNDGWQVEYQSGSTVVSSRAVDPASFRMLRMRTVLKDVNADTLYDVLHDPVYRKSWDKNMVESRELGCLNPNNDISYYAMKCPPPLRNRDFVLQRSWLQTPKEYYIINHSVFHKSCPKRQEYIRGLSHLTGFLITPMGNGCELGYVAHSDPGGRLPVWITNKLSTVLAPKMIKRLNKAALNYKSWKQMNHPGWKPWLYPEQMENRISIQDCVREEGSGELTPEDESELREDDIQIQVD